MTGTNKKTKQKKVPSAVYVLPDDWTEHMSLSKAKVYYQHKVTKQTQWHRPLAHGSSAAAHNDGGAVAPIGSGANYGGAGGGVDGSTVDNSDNHVGGVGGGGGGVSAAPASATNRRGDSTTAATAMYDYTAADDDEVSVRAGDLLSDMQAASSEGWVVATVTRTGLRGTVPANYIAPTTAATTSA
jgi:hypothetical protein